MKTHPCFRNLALAGLLACHTLAHAKTPSPQDAENAEQLMVIGKKKLEDGDCAGATVHLKAAYSVVRVPTIGLALARAQERCRWLVEARHTAQQVVGYEDFRDPPVSTWVEAKQQAVVLARSLDARIPSMLVLLEKAPKNRAFKIVVDDQVVQNEIAGFPQRVNPGHHRVLLVMDGFDHVTTEIDAPEEKVVIPIRITLTPRRRSPLILPGVTAAVVGVTVGAVAGVASLAKASQAKENCSRTQCWPAAEPALHSATRLAWTSNAGFALAILGGATAAVGYLTSPDVATRHVVTRRGVRPVVSLDGVGITGVF